MLVGFLFLFFSEFFCWRGQGTICQTNIELFKIPSLWMLGDNSYRRGRGKQVKAFAEIQARDVAGLACCGGVADHKWSD